LPEFPAFTVYQKGFISVIENALEGLGESVKTREGGLGTWSFDERQILWKEYCDEKKLGVLEWDPVKSCSLFSNFRVSEHPPLGDGGFYSKKRRLIFPAGVDSRASAGEFDKRKYLGVSDRDSDLP